jgi:hypothetical protein
MAQTIRNDFPGVLRGDMVSQRNLGSRWRPETKKFDLSWAQKCMEGMTTKVDDPFSKLIKVPVQVKTTYSLGDCVSCVLRAR